MTARTFAAPLRVAGIGAGYFSQFHYDAWKRISDTALVAVADRAIGKADAVGVAAYSDPAVMLAEIRPDLVDIVTPPDTHLAMIELAVDAGAGAVICQKPFCDSLESAERAVALADAAGIRLVVHENFRFQPWYRRMKRELAAGRVGTPLQLTFRLRPGDGQGADAYLSRQPYFQTMPRFLIHETGVHWIDTFRFLFGQPESVYADLRKLNPAIAGEDAGWFAFNYDSGLRAVFDGNRLLDHPAKNRRMTMGECSLEGTDGEIRLDGDGALRFRQRGANDWLPISDPPAGVGFGGDCVFALQAHVARGLLKGAPIENEARSYVANMRIESCIYLSAETGAKVVIAE